MPITQTLADFRHKVTQCDNLIVNSHKVDLQGNAVLPELDKQQITAAAFLNLFIAWEEFLEQALTDFMVGEPTMNGSVPMKYVSPIDRKAAGAMMIGVMRYFDYAQYDNVRKIAGIYFDRGYPFEPILSGIVADLQDSRTVRNACAHISTSTQSALEALAVRIFGQPRRGITVYQLLTAIDPRVGATGTVFATYRDKLVTAAELIANG